MRKVRGGIEQERVQVICQACGQQVEAVAKDGQVKGYCAVIESIEVDDHQITLNYTLPLPPDNTRQESVPVLGIVPLSSTRGDHRQNSKCL